MKKNSEFELNFFNFLHQMLLQQGKEVKKVEIKKFFEREFSQSTINQDEVFKKFVRTFFGNEKDLKIEFKKDFTLDKNIKVAPKEKEKIDNFIKNFVKIEDIIEKEPQKIIKLAKAVNLKTNADKLKNFILAQKDVFDAKDKNKILKFFEYLYSVQEINIENLDEFEKEKNKIKKIIIDKNLTQNLKKQDKELYLFFSFKRQEQKNINTQKIKNKEENKEVSPVNLEVVENFKNISSAKFEAPKNDKNISQTEFEAPINNKSISPIEFKVVESDKSVSPIEFEVQENDKNISSVEFEVPLNDKNISPIEFKVEENDKNISSIKFEIQENNKNISQIELDDPTNNKNISLSKFEAPEKNKDIKDYKNFSQADSSSIKEKKEFEKKLNKEINLKTNVNNQINASSDSIKKNKNKLYLNILLSKIIPFYLSNFSDLKNLKSMNYTEIYNNITKMFSLKTTQILGGKNTKIDNQIFDTIKKLLPDSASSLFSNTINYVSSFFITKNFIDYYIKNSDNTQLAILTIVNYALNSATVPFGGFNILNTKVKKNINSLAENHYQKHKMFGYVVPYYPAVYYSDIQTYNEKLEKLKIPIQFPATFKTVNKTVNYSDISGAGRDSQIKIYNGSQNLTYSLELNYYAFKNEAQEINSIETFVKKIKDKVQKIGVQNTIYDFSLLDIYAIYFRFLNLLAPYTEASATDKKYMIPPAVYFKINDEQQSLLFKNVFLSFLTLKPIYFLINSVAFDFDEKNYDQKFFLSTQMKVRIELTQIEESFEEYSFNLKNIANAQGVVVPYYSSPSISLNTENLSSQQRTVLNNINKFFSTKLS